MVIVIITYYYITLYGLMWVNLGLGWLKFDTFSISTNASALYFLK